MQLSNRQLELYLNRIKEMLCMIDLQALHNVIFLNKYSFYVFARGIRRDKGQSLGALVDAVSSYIPRTVIGTEEYGNAFPEDENAKSEFLYMLHAASTPAQWQEIKLMCETIRLLKSRQDVLVKS